MNIVAPNDKAELGFDLEVPSLTIGFPAPSASFSNNDTGRTNGPSHPTQSSLKYASRLFIPSTACLLKVRRQNRGPCSCRESSCGYRKFSDKAGLQHHIREVHGPEVHYCQIVSCRRHKKGFGRRSSLICHHYHRHPDVFLHPIRQCKDNQSNAIERVEHDSASISRQEWPNRGVEKEKESRGGKDSIVEDKLNRKLQDLKELRAEMNRDINEDIGALERDLSMINSS